MSGNDNASETTTITNVNYTCTLNDYDVLVIGASAAVAITIPSAIRVGAGRRITVYKDAAAQVITIQSSSGLIDTLANTTLATGAIHAKSFISDGANWFTVTSY